MSFFSQNVIVEKKNITTITFFLVKFYSLNVMLEKHFMTIPYMVKSFILILVKNSMVVVKALFYQP